MSLPDKSKLQSLAKKTKAEKEQLGLPTTDDWFWPSSGYGVDSSMYGVKFSDGALGSTGKDNTSYKVLCVGD